MALCVNQSGTWRKITTQCVNQSGTWRIVVNGCINESGTWRKFGFQPTTLGASFGGGYAICMSSNVVWIVSPYSAEVSRNWYSIDDANTTAQSVSGCTGWFVPTISQLQNPGYTCRSFWDSSSFTAYWTSTEIGAYRACIVKFNNGATRHCHKNLTYCVRAFRCVTY